jgi:hypothetical protein
MPPDRRLRDGFAGVSPARQGSCHRLRGIVDERIWTSLMKTREQILIAFDACQMRVVVLPSFLSEMFANQDDNESYVMYVQRKVHGVLLSAAQDNRQRLRA